MARCTVVSVAESVRGTRGRQRRGQEKRRGEARREGEGYGERATERQLDIGEGTRGKSSGERSWSDEWWGLRTAGTQGSEGRDRPKLCWFTLLRLASAARGNLASARRETPRWGYSYNQPSRGTVVMVTTTTTTRSGLGGVFKDIFAFAASLHPIPLPLPALLSCSLVSLSLSLSSLSLRSIFVLFSSSLRFGFFILVLLFPAPDDCLSSRDL